MLLGGEDAKGLLWELDREFNIHKMIKLIVTTILLTMFTIVDLKSQTIEETVTWINQKLAAYRYSESIISKLVIDEKKCGVIYSDGKSSDNLTIFTSYFLDLKQVASIEIIEGIDAFVLQVFYKNNEKIRFSGKLIPKPLHDDSVVDMLIEGTYIDYSSEKMSEISSMKILLSKTAKEGDVVKRTRAALVHLVELCGGKITEEKF